MWPGHHRTVGDGLATFLGHSEQLESAITGNQARVESIETLLTMAPAEITALADTSADRMLRFTTNRAGFDPSDAALEALLSANVLENISDLELRRGIAAWPGRVRRTLNQQESVGAALRQTSGRAVELGVWATSASVLREEFGVSLSGFWSPSSRMNHIGAASPRSYSVKSCSAVT